ncbi:MULTISPECIES: hypothetical protein [unclassified Mesorhizobium]
MERSFLARSNRILTKWYGNPVDKAFDSAIAGL